MKKNREAAERRARLVTTAMNNKDEAAKILEGYAARLRETRSTVDRVKLLSEVLCISEVTLYRDISNL